MSHTKWSSYLAIAALLLRAGTVWSADPAANSAQQKVLDQFVGGWQTTYTVPKTEWTAQEKSGKADLVTTRVVGGRYIQEKSEHSDSTSGSAIITYDEQRKCYRSWWFSSTGRACESTGQWDANSRTMTWTSNQDAVTSVTRHRFLDNDNAEWSVAIKDGRGKVFFRMDGTSVRTPVAK